MKKFTVHDGIAAPMVRNNVDTDAIILKQFLKSISRTGYGPNAFFDWRYTPDGSSDDSFELNHPPVEAGYAEVQVLRMNGLPVGVEWLRLRRDDEGDVRIDVASSLLIPRSESELLAEASPALHASTACAMLSTMACAFWG